MSSDLLENKKCNEFLKIRVFLTFYRLLKFTRTRRVTTLNNSSYYENSFTTNISCAYHSKGTSRRDDRISRNKGSLSGGPGPGRFARVQAFAW